MSQSQGEVHETRHRDSSLCCRRLLCSCRGVDLPVTILATTPTGPRSVEVQGTLTNTSGKKLSTVVVTIPLYGDGNVRVGQATATVMNVKPGELWAFAALGAASVTGPAKLGALEVLAISE